MYITNSFAEFATSIANQRTTNPGAVSHFFTNVTVKYDDNGLIVHYDVNKSETNTVTKAMLDWDKMAHAYGHGGGKMSDEDYIHYLNKYSDPGNYTWNDGYINYTLQVRPLGGTSFGSSPLNPLTFHQNSTTPINFTDSYFEGMFHHTSSLRSRHYRMVMYPTFNNANFSGSILDGVFYFQQTSMIDASNSLIGKGVHLNRTQLVCNGCVILDNYMTDLVNSSISNATFGYSTIYGKTLNSSFESVRFFELAEFQDVINSTFKNVTFAWQFLYRKNRIANISDSQFTNMTLPKFQIDSIARSNFTHVVITDSHLSAGTSSQLANNHFKNTNIERLANSNASESSFEHCFITSADNNDFSFARVRNSLFTIQPGISRYSNMDANGAVVQGSLHIEDPESVAGMNLENANVTGLNLVDIENGHQYMSCNLTDGLQQFGILFNSHTDTGCHPTPTSPLSPNSSQPLPFNYGNMALLTALPAIGLLMLVALARYVKSSRHHESTVSDSKTQPLLKP